MRPDAARPAGRTRRPWRTAPGRRPGLEALARAGPPARSRRKDAAGLAAERERLQWQVEELDRLDLGQDEWDALQSEHTRLAHAQSLLDGAGQILEALDGDGDSAHHRLNSAGQRLQQMLRHDPGLQGVVDEIESARIAVSEAVSDLNNYVSRVDLDPQRLADVEARLSAVFETARKFRVEPDGLCGLREDLHAAVALQAAADIDSLRERPRPPNHVTTPPRPSSARPGARSPGSRQAGHPGHADAGHAGGRFEPTLSPATPSAHGNEQVEFLVMPAPRRAPWPGGLGRRAVAHLAGPVGHRQPRGARAR